MLSALGSHVRSNVVAYAGVVWTAKPRRGHPGELRQALAQVRAPEADLLWIATATGPFNGTSVSSDGRLPDIERALDAIDDLLPARIMAMTPYTHEVRRTRCSPRRADGCT